MTKEKYNSLASYQKEAYDKWNKGNKRGLIAGWILEAIVTVIVLNLSITYVTKNGESLSVIEVFQDIFFGALIGGIFPGAVHLSFLFKKVKLGLFIFNIIVYLLIVALIFYGGWIFLVIDTVLFIIRKPLIYIWEDKLVLTKADQDEWARSSIARFQTTSTASTADKLNELTQMLNSGLITQEEFDAKKAEIMSRM